MSYTISILGPKDGQGATTAAVAVADVLARRHPTLLVDADMSGTGTVVDALHLNPERRGMNSLLGEGPITPEMLMEESIPTRNPRLSVVPGLRAICGSDVATWLERLNRGGALVGSAVDCIVLDLGAAWAHPWLPSARASAQAVARLSNRVLVVFQDSPARMARAIQVLRAAAPPKAELLLVETRRGSLNRQAREAIRYNLPDLALAATIRWDPRRAMAAEDRGTAMPDLGEHLVRSLRLLEGASRGLEPSPPPAQGLTAAGA